MGQWHELRHRCILALEGSGVGRDNLHIQCLYVQPRGSSAIGVNVMFNKEEQRDLAHQLDCVGLNGELKTIDEYVARIWREIHNSRGVCRAHDQPNVHSGLSLDRIYVPQKTQAHQ
jgi:hypothetical protein